MRVPRYVRLKFHCFSELNTINMWHIIVGYVDIYFFEAISVVNFISYGIKIKLVLL